MGCYAKEGLVVAEGLLAVAAPPCERAGHDGSPRLTGIFGGRAHPANVSGGLREPEKRDVGYAVWTPGRAAASAARWRPPSARSAERVMGSPRPRAACESNPDVVYQDWCRSRGRRR